MGYERVWERLLEHLGELGSAREVEGRDGEVRAVYPELPDGSSVEDT